MESEKKEIKQKLFEAMAMESRIDLELLNSQDWPVFTSQFDQDPVRMPEKEIPMENDEIKKYNSFVISELKPRYRNMLKQYYPDMDENTLKKKEDFYFRDMMLFDAEGNPIPYPEYIKIYGENEDSDGN